MSEYGGIRMEGSRVFDCRSSHEEEASGELRL